MGPTKYGIGSTARNRLASFQAAPLSPESGSGGPGILRGMGETARARGLDFSAATSEVREVTTGRVTLGMVNATVLVMILFYYWTRSAQGGG